MGQYGLAQEQELAEEIVITGSRMRGVEPVGSTVTTLGRDEIENSGQVTLDRILQDLPQVIDVGFSENSRAQTAGNGNATWSNSINLRGLSPYGTLILTGGTLNRTSLAPGATCLTVSPRLSCIAG